MRLRTLLAPFALLWAAGPALAAPAPLYSTPKALLEGVYAEIVASGDWENYDYEKGFDPHDTFSAALQAEIVAADAIVNPDGDSMGALDFSPFINGQDSSGLSFEVGMPKTKGDNSSAPVEVWFEGRIIHDIVVFMVQEPDGWKVDDFEIAGDNGSWRLSDYLADPLN